jgi:hypothetical protein
VKSLSKWLIHSQENPLQIIFTLNFFWSFCAGENASEIQPVIRSLSNAGIGAILDYAVEADVFKRMYKNLVI